MGPPSLALPAQSKDSLDCASKTSNLQHSRERGNADRLCGKYKSLPPKQAGFRLALRMAGMTVVDTIVMSVIPAEVGIQRAVFGKPVVRYNPPTLILN